MSQYQSFIFKHYAFDVATKTLTLDYSYDNTLNFQETYHFDFDFSEHDPAVLDRACQLLFFVAGVSYYKLYLAPTIAVEAGQVDPALASFLSQTYQKGLGEFFYVNQLDPRTSITFPINSPAAVTLNHTSDTGLVIGVGGGKDSLVSIELLRESGVPVTTWSVGHRSQLTPLVERIGLPHLWVERTWDITMLDHNASGAYNGHVPISAIFAATGSVVAVLSGKRDVVVSNEHSANEPTLEYEGLATNHQYSKSQEFEASFQALLHQNFGDSLRYYSLLRPFSELKIAELFSPHFETYHEVFSSCNRAFTHIQNHIFWDGSCPKCAFVFMALTPFVDRDKLERLFDGKNLLLDPALETTYRNLLGIEGEKPLECVGEIKESRAAMRLAQQQYPELRYQFELPDDYNFRSWQSHCMPAEIFTQLQQRVN